MKRFQSSAALTFYAVLVFGTANLTATAPARAGDEAFTFVQMADTQFGFFASPLWLAYLGYNGWRPNQFERETDLYRRAIVAANRLKPAFVVICGDLVNQPGNDVQMAEFERLSRGLDPDIPLHRVAGNHDVGNSPTPESLAWYRAKAGPDWYSFRHGPMAGIVLNSSLIAAPDDVRADAEAQWTWLGAELARLQQEGAAPILVFQHHSYFLEEPDEEDAYFNLELETRMRYLKRLREAGVSAVFAGHYHRNGYGRYGPLEMITTGPVGRPLGDDPSGFRVIHVDGAQLDHRYVPIDLDDAPPTPP